MWLDRDGIAYIHRLIRACNAVLLAYTKSINFKLSCNYSILQDYNHIPHNNNAGSTCETDQNM